MVKNRAGGIWDTVKTLFYAVMIAVFIRTFAFEPFNIPSGSNGSNAFGEIIFSSQNIHMGIAGTLPLSFPIIPGRIFLAQSQNGGRRGI